MHRFAKIKMVSIQQHTHAERRKRVMASRQKQQAHAESSEEDAS